MTYIHLKRVDNFSTTNPAQSKNKPHTPNIHSLRHLRNLQTHHTNPVVVIDHGQSAMLAKLNGIRSTPTLAKGMPTETGYRNNLDPCTSGGGTYTNDRDYDAREWGLPYPNMTLDAADFKQESSWLVRKAVHHWVEGEDRSALVQQGFYPDKIEQLIACKNAKAEEQRKFELKCLMEHTMLEICMCGGACAPQCVMCDTCIECSLVGELVVKTPEEIQEAKCKPECHEVEDEECPKQEPLKPAVHCPEPEVNEPTAEEPCSKKDFCKFIPVEEEDYPPKPQEECPQEEEEEEEVDYEKDNECISEKDCLDMTSVVSEEEKKIEGDVPKIRPIG